MKKKIIITIFAIILVLGTVIFVNRVRLKEIYENWKKDGLPEAKTYDDVQKKLTFVNGDLETVDIISVNADLKIASENKKQEIPTEFNLAVPFTSQAPLGVWDGTHEETCEEASVLMAASFILDKKIESSSTADADLLAIVDWEKKNFGFWKDTNAERTANMLEKIYNLHPEIKYGITIKDIKEAIAGGSPVILPAAGRDLKNQYFTAPGPLYHMLVAKGYTKEGKIITNDPGTKRGADYLYDPDVLYNAIHDWNGGDVANGKKVMIIIKR